MVVEGHKNIFDFLKSIHGAWKSSNATFRNINVACKSVSGTF